MAGPDQYSVQNDTCQFTCNSFLEHAENIQTYLPSYIFWSTSGSKTKINTFININTNPDCQIKRLFLSNIWLIVKLDSSKPKFIKQNAS